jgi:hypothetical protein
MKTKNTYRLLIAALFCGAVSVQAQISKFSVVSYSDTGSSVQIPGVITSQNAVLKVESNCGGTLGINNMTWIVGPYYSISQGAGGTALANVASGPEYVTTSIETASSSGYTAGPHITDCSGRFFIESQYWVWDDEWEISGHYEGGTGGAVNFTVGSSHSFNLQVLGKDNLSAYSLTGLEQPVCQLWKGSTYIDTYYGEGSHNLNTLSTGDYQLYVYGGTPEVDNSPFQSGIVVASIVAN